MHRMQGWIRDGTRCACRGRPTVAVMRRETIWKLRQEMDSKGKSILWDLFRELLLELLSNASGGIYPRAR